jgi:hypothetical protein
VLPLAFCQEFLGGLMKRIGLLAALAALLVSFSANSQSPQLPSGTDSNLRQSSSTQPPTSPNKDGVKKGVTAAEIAAILIAASRSAYHSTGRPCACPDDLTRNGSACGGRSAYSRPGGAAPLCYPQDITPAMIEAYKQQTASANQ